VANEDHAAQVLELEHAEDVRNMRFEVDVPVCLVRALAKARIGGRENLMPARAAAAAFFSMPSPPIRPRALPEMSPLWMLP
jgi:hypothetical protein